MDEAIVDSSAILGYPSERAISDRATTLQPPYRLRSGTVVYEGVVAGANLQTGHNVVIREQTVIGADCSIWSNTVVDYGCRLGDRVRIHANCYIAQNTTIEDGCFLAPGVTLANDRFPNSGLLVGPILEQGCRLGVNVTVLPGVRIGRGALVGAGAVVTADVPPESVVYGNPAHVHGSIFDLRTEDGAAAYGAQPG